MTEIVVPKGTTMLCNIAAVNADKAIWGDDAHEWKPERWLGQSPHPDARIPGVYGNILTFAGGARSCMYVALESSMSSTNIQAAASSSLCWR